MVLKIDLPLRRIYLSDATDINTAASAVVCSQNARTNILPIPSNFSLIDHYNDTPDIKDASKVPGLKWVEAEDYEEEDSVGCMFAFLCFILPVILPHMYATMS